MWADGVVGGVWFGQRAGGLASGREGPGVSGTPLVHPALAHPHLPSPFHTNPPVGCEDGRVCVFDIDTSGIARSWRPHAAPVTCLAWSRDGKRVASGAMDRTLALGDVFGASVVSASADLGGTVVAVSLGAAGPDTAVASFPSGPPRLVRLAAAGDAGTVLAIPPLAAPAGPGGRGGSVLTAAAVADPARGVVFVGQARGLLSVIHAPTGRVLDVIKCPGAPRAQALALGCGGGGRGAHRLIVTCHDRAVRLYDLAPVQTFKEAVVGAGAGAVVGLDGSPGLTAAAAGEAIAGAGKNPAPGSLLRREAPLATLTAELCQAVDRSAWRGASLSDDGTWVAAAVQARRDWRVWWGLDRLWGHIGCVPECAHGATRVAHCPNPQLPPNPMPNPHVLSRVTHMRSLCGPPGRLPPPTASSQAPPGMLHWPPPGGRAARATSRPLRPRPAQSSSGPARRANSGPPLPPAFGSWRRMKSMSSGRTSLTWMPPQGQVVCCRGACA